MAGVAHTSQFLGFDDGDFRGEDLTLSPSRLLQLRFGAFMTNLHSPISKITHILFILKGIKGMLTAFLFLKQKFLIAYLSQPINVTHRLIRCLLILKLAMAKRSQVRPISLSTTEQGHSIILTMTCPRLRLQRGTSKA